MTTRADRRRQRGFALILVLWVLGLLALMIAMLVANGRNDLGAAGGVRASAAVQAAADGAISHAIFEITIGTWEADATRHFVSIGPVNVAIVIEDQGGRIDPNFSSPPLITALLASVGVDPARASVLGRRIADWHTTMPFSLEGGLKLQLYRDLGLGYGPPNRPFRSTDEVGLVPGVSSETLDRLRSFLSVYPAADPHATNGGESSQLASSMGGVGAADIMTSPIASADRVLEVRAVAYVGEQARFVRKAVVRLANDPRAGRSTYQILTWE
jgi:general secretion pathway protein K